MITDPSTPLTGTRDLIDDALRRALDDCTSSFTSKQTCIDLAERRPDTLDIEALIPKVYQKIEQNWKSVARRTPSSKNWDLTWKLATESDDKPREVRLAAKSASAEVVLERLIIQAVLNRHQDDWFHQCPTASGVYSTRSDRCHIDLIRQISDEEFELVELKVASNNPVFAAFEILRNGLLYLHARRCLDVHYAGKRLLKATKVRLTVLAPFAYYTYKRKGRSAQPKVYDLGWFEKGLSRAISVFAKNECEMIFAFDVGRDLEFVAIRIAEVDRLRDFVILEMKRNAACFQFLLSSLETGPTCAERQMQHSQAPACTGNRALLLRRKERKRSATFAYKRRLTLPHPG